MNADTPIIGCRRVAAEFGVSPGTLKRWKSDAEMEQRLRLRDFTFRLNGRWATTERLVNQFVGHLRNIDPREMVRREVAEVAKEIRK
jgi:transposase-like protein